MPKTENFANHCVLAKENTENVSSQQHIRVRSFASQKSAEVAEKDSPFNDLIAQDSILQLNPNSLTDWMLMRMVSPLSSQTKVNYDRDVPNEGAIKSKQLNELPIVPDILMSNYKSSLGISNQMIDSREALHEESSQTEVVPIDLLTEVSLNSHLQLSPAESSLQETHMTTVQDKSGQILQSRLEQTTSKEVSTVEESLLNVPGDLAPKTTGKLSPQRSTRFSAKSAITSAETHGLYPRKSSPGIATLKKARRAKPSNATTGIKSSKISSLQSVKEVILPNSSVPTTIQSDSFGLNEVITVPPALRDHCYSKSNLKPASKIQPRIVSVYSLATASEVKSTATLGTMLPQRPIRNRNKNSTILLAPPVSTLQSPKPLPSRQRKSGSSVRNKPHQTTLDPEKWNAASNSAAIQMVAKSKLIPPAEKKRKSKFSATATSKSTPVTKALNSIPVIATSSKRRNNENISSIVPSKVRKAEKPVQRNMTKIATSFTFPNLPDISIQRSIGDVKKSAAAVVEIDLTTEFNSENRSISECVKMLERNSVSIFKVPQPPHNVLGKYSEMFQMNNISVERVTKK